MNKHAQWSSKVGFILAAAGSAIGIGAIWKLPYVTGVSGGGAFFLLFILFSLFVGFPLLLAEFVVGRSTQKEAISAYNRLRPAHCGLGSEGSASSLVSCFYPFIASLAAGLLFIW